MANLDISINNNQDRFEINTEQVNYIAEKMLEYIIEDEDLRESSVFWNIDLEEFSIGIDVLFCDDAEIETLNISFRDKSCPTDVLSFALFADNPDIRFIADSHVSLGEVVISTETAMIQAKENSKTFEQEVYFLLSHGLLHLLGFDHPDEGTLEDMLALQQEMTDFALK